MATDPPGNNARNQLLELERRRQIAVVSEFEKIKKRLNGDLLDLLERIEKQRRIDGNASPQLLFRKARVNELLDAVNDEIRQASVKLGMLTQSAQTSAIQIAQTQASKTPELHTSLNFFDGPATRELIGIAGDGSPLAVHFGTMAEPLRTAMFDALFYGIAAGKGNALIARDVRDAIGGTTARAMTIVRTETNRAYREATRQFYAEAPGVIGWRWLAALDLRTCPICWALHGRIFKTKTKFGTHPNCRCTLVPVFGDDEHAETGPEVFARLNDAQRKTILGPRRLELYKQGAELSDFVQQTKTTFGIGRRIRPLDKTRFTPKPRRPDEPPFPGSIRTPPVPTPKPPKAKADRPTTPKAALPAAATIEPGTPTPTFTTAAEAVLYMEQRYPGTLFDYAGMDPELVNPNAAEMARLIDLYPETAARLKYVGTYADKTKIPRNSPGRVQRGAYAHCSNDGNFIAYSKKSFANIEDLRKSKKRGFEIGWSVSGEVHSTTTHEFGHAVDSWIRSNGSARFNKFAFADGRNEIGSIAERIAKELKPKYGELSDYAIKGRGRSQRSEQFAEAFSQRWNREQKDWAAYTKAQKLLIEKMQSSKMFPASDAIEFRELNEKEKELARREFDDFIISLGLKVKKL